MTMMGFYELFPQEAERDFRTVRPLNDENLPEHDFLLTEAYCFASDCDCRRVMLNVIDVQTSRHVATINYGFEPPKAPLDDEDQAFLDPLNPQSSLSKALLKMFEEMLPYDPGYHDRLVRHYEMWKSVVDDPTHPLQARIRAAREELEAEEERIEPLRRSGPKIGANAPCPCGSGRKYKKCCRPGSGGR